MEIDADTLKAVLSSLAEVGKGAAGNVLGDAVSEIFKKSRKITPEASSDVLSGKATEGQIEEITKALIAESSLNKELLNALIKVASYPRSSKGSKKVRNKGRNKSSPATQKHSRGSILQSGNNHHLIYKVYKEPLHSLVMEVDPVDILSPIETNEVTGRIRMVMSGKRNVRISLVGDLREYCEQPDNTFEVDWSSIETREKAFRFELKLGENLPLAGPIKLIIEATAKKEAPCMSEITTTVGHHTKLTISPKGPSKEASVFRICNEGNHDFPAVFKGSSVGEVAFTPERCVIAHGGQTDVSIRVKGIPRSSPLLKSLPVNLQIKDEHGRGGTASVEVVVPPDIRTLAILAIIGYVILAVIIIALIYMVTRVVIAFIPVVISTTSWAYDNIFAILIITSVIILLVLDSRNTARKKK